MRGCTRGRFATNEPSAGPPQESHPLAGGAQRQGCRHQPSAAAKKAPSAWREGAQRQRVSMVKILVVKRDKIGDLLLTTPLFTILKRSLPDARIHVLANDYNAWVVADNRTSSGCGSIAGRATPDRCGEPRCWSRSGSFSRCGRALRRRHAAGGEEVAAGDQTSAGDSCGTYDRLRRRWCTLWRTIDRSVAAAREAVMSGANVWARCAIGCRVTRCRTVARIQSTAALAGRCASLARASRVLRQKFCRAGRLSARDASKQPSPEQALRWAQRFKMNGDVRRRCSPRRDASKRVVSGQRCAGTADSPPHRLTSRIPDGLPAAIGIIALARTSILPDSGLMHFAAAVRAASSVFSPTPSGCRRRRAGGRVDTPSLVAQHAIDALDDAMVLRPYAAALAIPFAALEAGSEDENQYSNPPKWST